MDPATKSVAFRRPSLYPKQTEAVFCTERYGLVEASTKSGKTHACIAWLTEQAFLNGGPGRNFWWVAPIFGQARIAYRRLKRAMQPPGSFDVNETELTITLPNGATIWFKGADRPDTLYGDDVCAAVLDESTRMREEAWHAVRSTLTATKGPVRIIGNVKGRGNWSYRMARRAESGAPDMHYAKITAYDAAEAGVLDADEIEDAKRQLPDNVFRELYLAEPSDDGGNPFGMEAIAGCVAPLSIDRPVCFGVDLGRAEDYTVVIGLDGQGAVCIFERWFHTPWPVTEKRIAEYTDSVRTLVDSTGVGDRVFVALQELGDWFEPYIFTQGSKQRLMEQLAISIQQGAISYPDGPIRQELEEFEYSYTRTGVSYSAPSGLHDDCVCALALAEYCHTATPPASHPYQYMRDDPQVQAIVRTLR